MKTTFIYKEVNGSTIKGDFYPTNTDNAPLIIYIHGGGLIWGSRADIHPEQITLYNEGGFNVCSIDYRLAPETKLSEIKTDIEDALIWFSKKENHTYNFDAENIAIIGSSAGAYLALLSGTFQTKPKVIVSFYGYGNILADWYTKPAAHFLSMTSVPASLANRLVKHKTISEAPIETRYAIYLHYRQQGTWVHNTTNLNPLYDADSIRIYCPVYNIDANFPATLLLHGDKDKDVPYNESLGMSQALTKHHIKNELITIPNGEHLFDQQMNDPGVIDVFQQVLIFLKENLA